MNSHTAGARPLISVVTVSFNRVADLEATLKDVIGQSYRGVEYVVVDGGSTDGSVDVLKKYNDHIALWRSERDRGIYDAMNKGAGLATGEWIIFMNAGDFFYDQQVLETCARELSADGSSVFVYGDAEIVQGDQRHVQFQQGRHLDQTKSIIHQSIFIRREFLKANPYDTAYRIMADYDNLLSVSATHPGQCRHVDIIVCRYDKTGVSSRPLYTYFKEYYRVARRRMTWIDFMKFNVYIFPRLIWSFRSRIR